MSDWSKDAAQKFQQKQNEESIAAQVLKYHAADQVGELERAFTEKIHEFNAENGNKVILNLYEGDDRTSFEVARERTPMRLSASLNKTKYEIAIRGMGGIIFNLKLLVAVDVSNKTTYLTLDNRPISAADIVIKSLNALLEI